MRKIGRKVDVLLWAGEMQQQMQQAEQQYASALDDPVNQDRRNFQVWDARYGMMVEDASAMCAGVHDHGWQTADEFAAFMGMEA